MPDPAGPPVKPFPSVPQTLASWICAKNETSGVRSYPTFTRIRWLAALSFALVLFKFVLFRPSYRIRASPPMVRLSMSTFANAGSEATIAPPTAKTAKVNHPETRLLMCIATLLLIVPCASLSIGTLSFTLFCFISGLLDLLLGVVGLFLDRLFRFLHGRFEILFNGFHFRLHEIQLGFDRLFDILRDVLQPLDRLADLPAHFGQLLRPEQQEGHDQDDQNLRDTKAKHGRVTFLAGGGPAVAPPEPTLSLARLVTCRRVRGSTGSGRRLARRRSRLSLRDLLRLRLVDCLLESFDGFSEAFTQLGELTGPEHDEDDDQNQ